MQLGSPSGSSNSSRFLVVSVAAAAGIASLLGCLIYRRIKNYLYWNSAYVRAGVVERLYVYPIKSCKGNSVPWMDCEERGGRFGEERDRYFLVVDALHDHMFLTARTYPRLVLIEASMSSDGELLIVRLPSDKRTGTRKSAPNSLIIGSERQEEGEEIMIEENDKDNEDVVDIVRVKLAEVLERADVRQAKLHRNARTDGYDCGDEIGRALTTFLEVEGKRELRLLLFAPKLFTERDFRSLPDYWEKNPVPVLQDRIGYADLAAYHAFCSASLDALNARLVAKGVEPLRDEKNFRPTILISLRSDWVSSAGAFDEDRWLNVVICPAGNDPNSNNATDVDNHASGAEFLCYKPCTRCVLTTVDPRTGEKHPELEPLRELRNFRLAPEGPMRQLFKDSPIFGVNLALIRRGRITTGDTVWVRYKPSSL